jgi:FkbM family methyltransferase
MMSMFKRLASGLPPRYQQELKRLHFARLIRKGTFTTAEEHDSEYPRLHQWVSSGDWVVDVGANVGNYCARPSQLVGARGRVFAFEPVPETFELLTANVARLPLRNVTLLNLAASETADLGGMAFPELSTGGDNRYMAHLTADPSSALSVMCLPVDALQIPRRVALVKVDVEGHELEAVRGMRRLLERDHPVLIVEGRTPEVASYLAPFGYSYEDVAGSPNRVFRCVR